MVPRSDGLRLTGKLMLQKIFQDQSFRYDPKTVEYRFGVRPALPQVQQKMNWAMECIVMNGMLFIKLIVVHQKD